MYFWDTFKIQPRSKSIQSNSRTAYRSRVRGNSDSEKLIKKEKNQKDFERGWVMIVYRINNKFYNFNTHHKFEVFCKPYKFLFNYLH